MTRIKQVKEYTKCDRCGVVMDGHKLRYHLEGHVTIVAFNGDVGGGKVAYDFCSDCSHDFERYLKEVSE